MSNTFYMRHNGNPHMVCCATIIPQKDEKQPYWVKYCKLNYSSDGKSVTIKSTPVAGQVGEDILTWWGNDQHSEPMADIVPKGSVAYFGLEICDEFGDPAN